MALVLLTSDGRSATDLSGDQLKLAIILTRHGVRSPLQTNEKLATYSSKPWPDWGIKRGVQTEHGNMLIAYMGDYYRKRFMDAGLLSGDAAVDGPMVFLRTDNDERTVATGEIIGKSLVQVGKLDAHALAEGTPDPLFRPHRAHVGNLDKDLAIAAVLARLGNSAANFDRAYATQFARLESVLYGPGATPPEGSEFNQPTKILEADDEYPVVISGPLIVAEKTTDALLLEYTQGMPTADVGWGRVDAKTMTDLLILHDFEFDLTQRTHYIAQTEASNLVSHIVDTLEQAATGEPVIGAIGPAGEKVVVIAGHDSNLASVGGLLDLNWWMSGTQANPMLPGGSLMFELWKQPGETGKFFVRVSYVSLTLEQMREATPASPEAVPFRCPIFVPDCSTAAPEHDATLASFVLHARRAILPEFTAPEPVTQLPKDDTAE